MVLDTATPVVDWKPNPLAPPTFQVALASLVKVALPTLIVPLITPALSIVMSPPLSSIACVDADTVAGPMMPPALFSIVAVPTAFSLMAILVPAPVIVPVFVIVVEPVEPGVIWETSMPSAPPLMCPSLTMVIVPA